METRSAGTRQNIQIPQELDPVIEQTLLTGRSQTQIDNPLEPSILTVPLKISEQTTGMIVLYGAAGENLERSEQHLLETLAAQTSVTLENAHLFEMTLRQGVLLEQRANRLAHILETSYDVLRLRPQSKGLWTQVCHIAQDALGFQIVAIYGLDNQHTLSLRALVGSDSPLDHQTCPATEFDRLLSPHSRISRSYHIRHDELGAHAGSDSACAAWTRQAFEHSDDHPAGTLLAPIEAPDGQIVGYLALGKPRDGRVPSLETIQTVEIFVNQVAIARENARLFAALEERLNQARRVNELAALHRLSTAVSSTLETEHIQHAAISEIAHALRPDVSCDLAALPARRADPARGRPPRARFRPRPASPLIHPEHLAAVIQGGRPQLLSSPGPETHADSRDHRALRVRFGTDRAGRQFESALLAPMSVRDQKIGVIGVFAQSRGQFDRQDLTLLDSMASTVAMAIENARLYAESKAFAKELAASQAQLVQSAKLAATGQLAASIAHEINNPLQAVQSCVYLIADGRAAGRPKRQIRQHCPARTRPHRAHRRTDARLSPSGHRGATGNRRQRLDRERAGPGSQTPAAQQHRRPDRSRSQTCPTIQAVGDHIKQVLLNLFLNALEAMPQGGTLQVRTKSLLPEDKGVIISIQDNGVGMGPEDLAHLFEPFYTTKPSGTGLGLSISYDIVAQHGGEILVDSEPGQGTTFTIRLPTSTGAQAWNKN